MPAGQAGFRAFGPVSWRRLVQTLEPPRVHTRLHHPTPLSRPILRLDDPRRPKAGEISPLRRFRGPKPYEVAVLNATIAALPDDDALALEQQVQLIERLQRRNEDRMVMVGFEDKRALEPLENQATDHCLAKLRLKGDFGSIPVAVMTHRGLLSSLEFRRSPRETNGRDVSVVLVSLHSGDPGTSGMIDSEEHVIGG